MNALEGNFPFEKRQNVLGRTNRLLSFDMTRTADKTTPATIFRCRRNVFTKLLHSNDRETQTDPQTPH
jgi:hypothetical protein